MELNQQPNTKRRYLKNQRQSRPRQSMSRGTQLHELSDKNYVAAVLLSFFLGGLAIDRFYLGFVGTGVIKLVTLGGFGIWSLIDYLRISFGNLKDKQGKTLQGYAKYGKLFKIIAFVIAGMSILVVPGLILLVIFASVPSLLANNRDTMRKNDMSIIANDLSTYTSSHHGSYPSEQNFSNGTFQISSNLEVLSLQDVQYAPLPQGCDEMQTPCTHFSLSTTLEKGGTYTWHQ